MNASPRLPRAPLRTLEAVHLHLIVCGAYGLVTSAAEGHPSEGIHAGLGILLGPTLVKVGRGVNAGMSRRTSANTEHARNDQPDPSSRLLLAKLWNRET